MEKQTGAHSWNFPTPILGLRFVQIDEFYPISSQQPNSFAHYVEKYYVQGFGMRPENALLMDLSEREGHNSNFIFSQAGAQLYHSIRKSKLLGKTRPV